MVLTAPAPRASGTSLTRRLRVALVSLSALFLVAVLALVVSLRQADRALADQTRQTFPARVAASQLLTSLVDQETGLRGFALSGDERFLDPYRAGIVAEQKSRAQLDLLIRPGDRARVALATLDAAITAWRDQYASLRTTTVHDAASDSTIQFGRELFERVRQTSATLDAQLSEDVRAAQERVDGARALVVAVLAVMVVALAIAVVGLQRALRTSVLRPLLGLAGQVAVVAGGDHDAPIRAEGPPDIQEIAAGIESMRVELVGALGELESQRRAVERRATELARSNADLEQFAYVASHDLQEPLRKVASFCQLLEQRYAGQLDERADQYIAFAVDGAKRMQQLISDLLTFSRVGRTSEGFAAVDLAAIARRSWSSLERTVSESGGRLELDVDLPTPLVGDASLLQMLLSNLFGNALKYRRTDVAPVVRMHARVDGSMARVDVADNGIGIPDEYAEKVFVIFQRLHGRDEYEGTGIGLALAKKIVEFHGGSITIAPSPLGGACLSFTLPFEETSARA